MKLTSGNLTGAPNRGAYLPRHLGLYSYALNNPLILHDRTGREEGDLGDSAVSFIPIIGPLRDFSRDLDKGNFGWAALDASMALLDAATLGESELLHAGLEGGEVLAKGAAKGTHIAQQADKVVQATEKAEKVVQETEKAAQAADEVKAGATEGKDVASGGQAAEATKPPAAPAEKGQPARFIADEHGNIVDTRATPPGRYIQPDKSATDILQHAEHPGLDPFTARTHTHPAEVHVNPKNPTKGSTRLGEPRPVTTQEVQNIMNGTATRGTPKGR